MLPIVGLCSSFAEGPLAVAAVESILPACERVYVAEGPCGDPDGEQPSLWPSLKRTHVKVDGWNDDADKRTYLLKEAQRYTSGKPFWALWIDGDETMQWARNLPLWCRRAELEPWEGDLKVSGGFPLRLVELDGTVVQAMGRVLRGDLVDEYLHSIVEVRLKDGETSISLPNIPNWTPAHTSETGRAMPADEVTAYNRPPLQGEPHYLHLSALRDPARLAPRQSEAEEEGYRERAAALGIALPPKAGAL